MAKKDKYADIILPLSVSGTFTYKIPDGLGEQVKIGMRVIVPFGQKKFYSGIIIRLHHSPPEGFKIREIKSVIDSFPVVNSFQLDFWNWIGKYYLCFPGEVMNASVPSGLKMESETVISLKKIPDKNIRTEPEELKLMTVLEYRDRISLKDLKKRTGIKNPEKWLDGLKEKGIISVEEQIKERYHPKTETYIGLNDACRGKDKLDHLLNSFGRAPKQYNLLLAFLNLSDSTPDSTSRIKKQELRAVPEFSDSAFRALVKKNILKLQNREVTRLELSEKPVSEPHPLTPMQQLALDEIRKSFRAGKVALLHGITSSGKTEIYFHLIKEQLSLGKQVLYLLPEIVLTAQIVRRLKAVFGNQAGIYHSRYSDAERVETYYHLLGVSGKNSIKIILGARSAVFLPFNNLGLIIVDEEHENTYKQSEPAPRYHARDAAIVLAGLHGADVVLGTATPSFETYYNALSGKYNLIRLNERYHQIELPEVRIVNLREQYRKKLMKSHFSPVLLNEIREVLQKKQQVILFQNRRGFSLYLECVSCGWIPYCRRCDVSLTYHKQEGRLVCHYCGYSIRVPGECPECHEAALRTRGFGTEKIEEELAVFFPDAGIVRFDLDTAHSKKQYEKIIIDFEEEKTDILIGTQIVSKGLDFNNVGLVGILNADNLLNFPDFRAYERSFQLLSQVAGRAGRKYKKGLVVLQTSDPENIVIKNVLSNDYEAIYKNQIAERKLFKYPPFYRLIKISLRHRNIDILDAAAKEMADELSGITGIHILGPQYPIIRRVKNWNIQDILIKIPRTIHLYETKKKVHQMLLNYGIAGKYKGLHVIPDVDPY
jgi:primosomal protein N' (replication factor Y)